MKDEIVVLWNQCNRIHFLSSSPFWCIINPSIINLNILKLKLQNHFYLTDIPITISLVQYIVFVFLLLQQLIFWNSHNSGWDILTKVLHFFDSFFLIILRHICFVYSLNQGPSSEILTLYNNYNNKTVNNWKK